MSRRDFESAALEAFGYQYTENELYRSYCQHLRRTPTRVRCLQEIPFLPVSFFKSHTVKSGRWQSQGVFSSSTTGGQRPSLHHVADLGFCESVSKTIFEEHYGSLGDWYIFGLLPSYLERSGSSLVYMVESFLRHSRGGGFYLYDYESLVSELRATRTDKTLLLGVSFALWDFAEKHPMPPNDVVVMETGGMKGRRQEVVREQLHGILSELLGIKEIHSEYGMTEMLSQCYSQGGGRFVAPRWCEVLIRQAQDPFSYTEGTGGINMIDLANIDSCCFLEISDIGKKHADGSFEVLGRLDHSDIRGCNLLF